MKLILMLQTKFQMNHYLKRFVIPTWTHILNHIIFLIPIQISMIHYLKHFLTLKQIQVVTTIHTHTHSNDNHNHQYNLTKVYNDVDSINENSEDENNYKEDATNQYEHLHRSSSVSSTSSFDRMNSPSSEEAVPSIHNNINYEREDDDYENQKPPVTVVTIPPLSPFELPAIAIPFSQPDPREVGEFSPIITTQPSLTTRPTSYPINNHLSIPYDHSRNFLNDYTSSSSYINNININTNTNTNTNNNYYNEQILSNSVHSGSKLAADDLNSPNYYPYNSQPYPSSQSSSHRNSTSQHYSSSSSQKNHWPSGEMSYTSQLIQRQKNNLTKRSIHSMASNSSVHLKNKAYVEKPGLSNTGKLSMHSNTNSIDNNPNNNSINNKYKNNNLTNSNPIYYLCTQKFIPQNKNELELNVGDIIEIYQTMNDEWCYGRNQTNKCVGAFPKDCITSMVSPNQKTPNQDAILKMEVEIEKLKGRKKMIDYLERRLQDPNLSNKDRELYQQHLDSAYLALE
eukprot:jgi/Orpsp1_1/1176406/evm.model.c7180000057487.1